MNKEEDRFERYNYTNNEILKTNIFDLYQYIINQNQKNINSINNNIINRPESPLTIEEKIIYI